MKQTQLKQNAPTFGSRNDCLSLPQSGCKRNARTSTNTTGTNAKHAHSSEFCRSNREEQRGREEKKISRSAESNSQSAMWTPPPPPPTRESDPRSPATLVSLPAETGAGATAQRLPSVFTLTSMYHHASYPHAATTPSTRMKAAASRHVRPAQSTTSSVTSASSSPALTQHGTPQARQGRTTVSPAGDDDEEPRLTVPAAGARTRPLTNSERGRQFRLREKVHEQNLIQQLKQLRLQIAQLENSQRLVKQRALTTRTCIGGSLEKITRELYTVFQFGLGSHLTLAVLDHQRRSSVTAVRSKESFLRSIVDQDVVYGDLFGVETLIDQWRKHTASYSKFEIEIDRVEPIAGSQTNPIVVIHTKLHARFSRETLSMMFPFILERRPDLASKFINRDITFLCVSRFTFSEEDRIVTYLVDINFVEALMKTVGSARDVAELMEFSVVTPLMTLRELDEQIEPQRYRDAEQCVGGDRDCETSLLHGSQPETRSYTREKVSSMQKGDWSGQDPAFQQHRRHPQPASFYSSYHDEESDDDTPRGIYFNYKI